MNDYQFILLIGNMWAIGGIIGNDKGAMGMGILFTVIAVWLKISVIP